MAKATKKKPARKRKTKAADGEIAEKRAKAYGDLESHLCAVVNMGTIASNLFDCSDKGLYDFAVNSGARCRSNSAQIGTGRDVGAGQRGSHSSCCGRSVFAGCE